MKEVFFGYYPPTELDYKQLWDKSLIVLDANILLSLYRLPPTAREELLRVLELLKQRVWIPHQVGLEFQRRRLGVISAQRKVTEATLSSAHEMIQSIKEKVESLQIDKHGLDLKAKPLLDNIEKANGELIKAVEKVHKTQLDITMVDPIRDRLDQILAGKIGLAPRTQVELDALVQDGEVRYAEKIPPGYMDEDKAKNPNETHFIYDGLKYISKFGDLIIWRQLIQYVKDEKLNHVMFVTADQKEDWWWREQGKTMGPRSELVRELRRDASVELFWMYPSALFMEHAKRYAAADVSEKAVAEIEEDEFVTQQQKYISKIEKSKFRFDAVLSRKAAVNWIEKNYGKIIHNTQSFPEYLLKEDRSQGFQLRIRRDIEKIPLSNIIPRQIRLGHRRLKNNELSEFTFIIVVRPIEIQEFSEIYKDAIDQYLRVQLSQFPITGIILGCAWGETLQILLARYPG